MAFRLLPRQTIEGPRFILAIGSISGSSLIQPLTSCSSVSRFWGGRRGRCPFNSRADCAGRTEVSPASSSFPSIRISSTDSIAPWILVRNGSVVLTEPRWHHTRCTRIFRQRRRSASQTAAVSRCACSIPVLVTIGEEAPSMATTGWCPIAVRKNSRSFSAVGLSENEILSGYRKHRTIYLTVAAFVTLVILAAMAFDLRHRVRLDRSQEALKELNQEISKQNARFDVALTNMPNGLSMFDADGKLLVWNSRYVEIYGMLPDVVSQGRQHQCDCRAPQAGRQSGYGCLTHTSVNFGRR